MPDIKIATSTADFTPAGVLGYAKGLSAVASFIGAVVLAISPYLPDDPTWSRWVGGILAACGAIGVFAFKNNIVPVQVADPPIPPPAPQPADFEPGEEVIDDEPGRHAVDRDALLGVVHPPVVNPDGPRAE